MRPSGDFLARISLPASLSGAAERADPPDRPDRPLPSSGPYYVSSTANGRVVLLPNPGYGGERSRRWARIVYTLDVPTSAGRGARRPRRRSTTSRWTSTSTLCSVAGACSTAATGRGAPPRSTGRQRYFPTIGGFVDYIVLNANRPLFRDARLRRAVNYALDRPALAAAFHDTPGDQIVPPGRRRLSRPARSIPSTGPTSRLPGGSQASGTGTPSSPTARSSRTATTASRPVAPIVKANLARIGIDVSIVRTDQCPPDYDASSSRADLLLVTNFGSHVSDPLPFLDRALARGRYASALGPGPWYSPSFRRRFEAARALRGTARTRAYVRLERELMRAAPFAVYGTFSFGQYVAPRIGCEVTTSATTCSTSWRSARATPEPQAPSVQVNRVRLSCGRQTRPGAGRGGRAARAVARRGRARAGRRRCPRGASAARSRPRRGRRPRRRRRARPGRRARVPRRRRRRAGRRATRRRAGGWRRGGRCAGRPGCRRVAAAHLSRRRARRRAPARPSRARRRRTAHRRCAAASRTRRPRARPRARASARSSSGERRRELCGVEVGRCVDEHEVGLVRAREPDQVGCRVVARERRRPRVRPVRADRGRRARQLVARPTTSRATTSCGRKQRGELDERADAVVARGRDEHGAGRPGASASRRARARDHASGSPARAPGAAPTARSRSSRPASCRVAR